MSSNRQLASALVGLVILAAVGAALLVWPNYQKARAVDEEIARLHEEIEVLSVRNQALARLARRVNRATELRDTECKRIPASPEIAELIGFLSREVDRRNVRNQRSTAGDPVSAVAGEQVGVLATPLTVDMEATFDSVFRLIRAAETTDRLIRVGRVRIYRDRDEKTDGSPIVQASVGLEIVHQLSAAGRVD
jgi:hypothetical protein